MLHSILPTYTVPALEDLEQFPHVRNSELTLYIHPRYVSVIHCDFRTPGGCGDWQIHQKYTSGDVPVAGSPKVHDRDCLIRLHAMTALLDFTRCSPSCSSYIRRTFVHLSCTYNQLTHSLQQVMSPAVATD